MSTSERYDLRIPSERDEACDAPWPGKSDHRCVFPYGHAVHWDGSGNVWLTVSEGYAAELAAAERRGWAQAIEALRAQAKVERREAATYPSGSPGRTTCLNYVVGVERAIRALTDLAAALTEEGGQ